MAKARKPTKEQPGTIVKQGAKFGLVGISNTVIDFTIYTALVALFNVPTNRVVLVKYVSGTVAMINSFYWNRKWTFQSKADIAQSGAKFVTATLGSIYLIQPGMVALFTITPAGVAVGTFWYNLANAIGLVHLAPGLLTEKFVVNTFAFGMGVIGSAIWNFTLYKFWAFKQN